MSAIFLFIVACGVRCSLVPLGNSFTRAATKKECQENVVVGFLSLIKHSLDGPISIHAEAPLQDGNYSRNIQA
jgi:hypothetical protein